MSLIKSFVLVLAALASVEALSTHGRSLNHHGLSRRLPQVLDTKVTAPMKRRSLRKRCKVRPSASAPVGGVVGNVGAAPTPKTTKEPAQPTPPTPTKTKSPPPAPKPTSKPGGGGGGPSYMSGIQTGEATYYGTGLGACGITNKDTDYIAAVSRLLFDTYPGYKGGNPNNNPICGRKVRATLRGKSVEVAITDRCVACALTDLDFSPAAFNKIGSVFTGRERGMTWEWI